MKITWILGLDIGQAQDHTALVAVERTKAPKVKANYAVRLIERLPLGIPYPQMLDMVAKSVSRSPLDKARMVIDYTGVGRPVFDMVRAAGFPCRCRPLLITAGHKWSEDSDGVYHVPKKDLVSTVQVLLGSERLQIAKKLEHSPSLEKEMRNFKVKITKSANETFGSWRDSDHDDMVLAMAMALWYGENVGLGDVSGIGAPVDSEGSIWANAPEDIWGVLG